LQLKTLLVNLERAHNNIEPNVYYPPSPNYVSGQGFNTKKPVAPKPKPAPAPAPRKEPYAGGQAGTGERAPAERQPAPGQSGFSARPSSRVPNQLEQQEEQDLRTQYEIEARYNQWVNSMSFAQWKARMSRN
jgi:hypothetical protein